MNDLSTEPSANGAAVAQTLAELERRVGALETKIAAIPDAQELEARVTQNVKAGLPPPPDPSVAPGFRDIEIPMPSVQNLVNTAKATWTLFEILRELRLLFWTLFDRRYHMAWMTRAITIVLLILIMTSQWWVPLGGFDSPASRTWEKVANLFLGFIMFFVLHYEMRRYREWRGQH